MHKEIDFEYDLHSAIDMKKLKKLAAELNDEFLLTVYREPSIDYFPKGRYLSYYLIDGKSLNRFGVTKVWKERAASTSRFNMIYEHTGWFLGNFVYFHNSKPVNVDGIMIREFPPVFYKAKDSSDYIRLAQKTIIDANDMESILMFVLKPTQLGGSAIESKHIFCIYKNDKIVFQIDNVYFVTYNNENWKYVVCMQHSKEFEMLDYIMVNVETLTTTNLGTLHYQKPALINMPGSYFPSDDFKQVDAENVYFYANLDEGKKSKIYYEYASCTAKIETMKNEFEDDFSTNVKVTICKNQLSNIEFIWMLSYELKRYSIYGYELSKIIHVACNDNPIAEALLRVDLTDVVFNQIKTVIERLLTKYCCNTEQLVEILKNKYGFCNCSSYKPDYILTSHALVRMPYSEQGITFQEYLERKNREKYDSFYSELILKGLISPKWKSETEMYKLISNCYSDAIYQYRAEWLGFQSIDVFVPSLGVAFEYQGIQHYEPVELFGGQGSFELRKQLDDEKRKKCRDSNIKLVEWRYDEPLNQLTLEKKIKDVSEME